MTVFLKTITAKFSRENFLLLLYLFAFFLPFDMFFCNLLTILGLLFAVLEHKISPPFDKGVNTLFFLFFGLFLCQLVGLAYTQDIKMGLFSTEKRLALLVFPLVFYFTRFKISPKDTKRLFFFFQLGLSTCVSYCIAVAMKSNYAYNAFESIQWKLFSDTLLDPIGINHLAYGIYAALALTYFVYQVVERKEKVIWYQLLFLAIITLGLVLLVPKMGWISIFFATSYILFRNRSNISIKYLVVAAILSGVILAIMLKIPKSRERIRQFTYGFSRNNIINDSTHYSSSRAGAFYASLDLIKEHWILGLGTGGIDKEMTKWYMDRNLSGLVGLDTHNQYFDFLLSYGILGLSFFLLSLFYPLWLAHQRSFTLYSTFLIIMIFSFLTENFLNNNKGIMFFSFFNSLFAGILNHNENVARENIGNRE